MAPKKKEVDRAADKAKQAAKDAKAADKTFGLKNKNKSKAVQQQVAQIKAAAKGTSLGKITNR